MSTFARPCLDPYRLLKGGPSFRSLHSRTLQQALDWHGTGASGIQDSGCAGPLSGRAPGGAAASRCSDPTARGTVGSEQRLAARSQSGSVIRGLRSHESAGSLARQNCRGWVGGEVRETARGASGNSDAPDCRQSGASELPGLGGTRSPRNGPGPERGRVYRLAGTGLGICTLAHAPTPQRSGRRFQWPRGATAKAAHSVGGPAASLKKPPTPLGGRRRGGTPPTACVVFAVRPFFRAFQNPGPGRRFGQRPLPPLPSRARDREVQGATAHRPRTGSSGLCRVPGGLR